MIKVFCINISFPSFLIGLAISSHYSGRHIYSLRTLRKSSRSSREPSSGLLRFARNDGFLCSIYMTCAISLFSFKSEKWGGLSKTCLTFLITFFRIFDNFLLKKCRFLWLCALQYAIRAPDIEQRKLSNLIKEMWHEYAGKAGS
jgi:hypothetical protein